MKTKFGMQATIAYFYFDKREKDSTDLDFTFQLIFIHGMQSPE